MVLTLISFNFLYNSRASFSILIMSSLQVNLTAISGHACFTFLKNESFFTPVVATLNSISVVLHLDGFSILINTESGRYLINLEPSS